MLFVFVLIPIILYVSVIHVFIQVHGRRGCVWCPHRLLPNPPQVVQDIFYHFVDMAFVNAFLLHKALCKAKGQPPMTQKAFRENLAVQLNQLGSQRDTPELSGPPWPREKLDMPVFMGSDRTVGRLKCCVCNSKIPDKCTMWDKALCFVTQRHCFKQWHDENLSQWTLNTCND